MPIVTRVRKELSADGTHRHIQGVCTDGGVYYTRQRVVEGIQNHENWQTYGGGRYAQIKPLSYCPAANCIAKPYITTHPDHTVANNLDNLPQC
jgi:hypothetical protein